MTPTSLLPKIAGAAGFSFDELCLAILDGARVHTRKSAAVASAPKVAPAMMDAADETSVVVRRYGAERRSQRSRTA
jgi:hypothetical protein